MIIENDFLKSYGSIFIYTVCLVRIKGIIRYFNRKRLIEGASYRSDGKLKAQKYKWDCHRDNNWREQQLPEELEEQREYAGIIRP